MAALAALAEAALCAFATKFLAAGIWGVALYLSIELMSAARRQALGWTIDNNGERQKVTAWNRGLPIWERSTTRMQRFSEEGLAKSSRRIRLYASGVIAAALAVSGWYGWLNVRSSFWMGGLFVSSAMIGGAAFLVWLVSLWTELLYLGGWQDMYGAQVLDAPPQRPGLAEVAAQKAHGDARLATSAEALSMLRAQTKTEQPPNSELDVQLGEYNSAIDDARPPLLYGGERHLLLFGPNGSGKGTGLLVPNLLSLRERSIVVIDPKGELAAITSDYRRTLGDVVVLNPFGVLNIESKGFNPLAALDPDSPTFMDDAAGIGEALIKIEERDPHWSESAQGLVVATIMWEVQLARRESRIPMLENVRLILTQPDEYEKDDTGKRRLVKGVRLTTARMIAEGGTQIASLISRFLRDTDEIASIQSTADRQTWWLLSNPMRDNLARNDLDFSELKKRPITVYVVLPAERMRTHSVWLRLIIVSALRALYTPGGLKTLFMLDEFAQLGHLAPVEDAFGLVRGYGVQLWPILQDLTQLKSLYKERWQTFMANAGVVQGFAPNDLETAEWMSRRAGDTTVVAAGYNAGDNQSSGSASQSHGMNYQQTKRALFLPQELMDFPPGTGTTFISGSSLTVTYYTPPYWDNEELRRRAKPNPYYST